MNYLQMSDCELRQVKAQLEAEYNEIKAMGLSLDLSRGKPGKEQLDLLSDMLTCVSSPADCISESGFDYRNYGILNYVNQRSYGFSKII